MPGVQCHVKLYKRCVDADAVRCSYTTFVVLACRSVVKFNRHYNHNVTRIITIIIAIEKSLNIIIAAAT